MDYVPLVEAEIVRIDKVKYMSIYISNLILTKSVLLSISLCNENKDIVKNVSMMIEGEEYDAWGSNDEYLPTLVAKKLGYTLE